MNPIYHIVIMVLAICMIIISFFADPSILNWFYRIFWSLVFTTNLVAYISIKKKKNSKMNEIEKS